MRILILPFMFSAGLMLSSCDSEPDLKMELQDQGSMAFSAPMMERSRAEPEPAPQSPRVERMLAYRYQFSFAIPARNLEAVSGLVVKDCQQAGMNNCQIVNSSVNRYAEDQVSANISLRVEPKWFADYQIKLTQSSTEAGGKMTSSNVGAEDLTIAITDNDAKLGALRTLRTRLQSLLETRGSTVKDLMAVERELARVQGQIESSTARLRVLRTRVSMSEVQLDYQTKAVAASQSSFRPIWNALNNFVGTVSQGLAGVIYFVALILPCRHTGYLAVESLVETAQEGQKWGKSLANYLQSEFIKDFEYRSQFMAAF